MNRKDNYQRVNLRRYKKDEKDKKLIIKWYQKEEIYSLFEEKRPNFRDIEEMFDKNVKAISSNTAFIIEFQGLPVGVVRYFFEYQQYNKYELMGNKHTIFRCDIFIGEPCFRNRKIGRYALKHLVKIIRSTYKNPRVYANIKKDNKQAIKCFRHAGFKRAIELDFDNTKKGVRTYVY